MLKMNQPSSLREGGCNLNQPYTKCWFERDMKITRSCPTWIPAESPL
jgi:hypothetical protein